MQDSTILDDADATQDTVTQLVAANRRVRRLLPAEQARLRLGRPHAKQALVSGLVNDALAVPGG